MKTKRLAALPLLQNVLLLWTLLCLVPAYLEPGASSYLLKLLISALVGIVVTVRRVRSVIRSLLPGRKPRQQEQPSSDG
jgi:hypothetical protein